MKRSVKKVRHFREPAGDPGTAAGDERAAVVGVWIATMVEEWDDEPDFRIFMPPGTRTEEIQSFLVENGYVETETIVPSYWLDDQPDDDDDDDPETAGPRDYDLILERDSEGKLRVKED